MRDIIVLSIIFGMMVSLSMCIDDIWKYPEIIDNIKSFKSSKEVKYNISPENTKEINLIIGGEHVQLVLRTTVREALSTKLINTNDSDIVKSYLNHKIIYIKYNKSLSPEEGKISVIDLSLKLGFLKPLYNHIIVYDTVFKNESEREEVRNSNITLILNVIKGSRNATIEKVNDRMYIIEGNSLEELDKAVSRYIMAVYKGIAEEEC